MFLPTLSRPAAAGAAGASFDGGSTGGPRPRWLASSGSNEFAPAASAPHARLGKFI
jgi:hypothetical protein